LTSPLKTLRQPAAVVLELQTHLVSAGRDRSVGFGKEVFDAEESERTVPCVE
jgi:hypothetical protein